MALLGATVVSMASLWGCGGGGGVGSDESACTVLKIAGGEQCSEAPRAIAIVASDAGYCTGAFITTRHVLTAAHCLPPGTKRVVIGAKGFSSDAARFDKHPRYDGNISSPYDIAVVTLKEANNVQPVPLELSRDAQVGDQVVTYGFGLDEQGEDIIKRVENGGLPLKATFLDVVGVDSGTILSQSDGSGDTCQGDSGGPLLTDGSNGQPGIVALVRAGPNVCVPNSGLPSENTNVQSQSATDFIFRIAPGAQAN
jgi:S1-C subfamily serine protease